MRIRYNRGDEILDISIRDQSGAKIEIRRCNLSDEEEYGRIVFHIYKKYGKLPKLKGKSLLDMDSEMLNI